MWSRCLNFVLEKSITEDKVEGIKLGPVKSLCYSYIVQFKESGQQFGTKTEVWQIFLTEKLAKSFLYGYSH